MDGVGALAPMAKGYRESHSDQMRQHGAASVANADIVFWTGPQMAAILVRSPGACGKTGACRVSSRAGGADLLFSAGGAGKDAGGRHYGISNR